MHPNDADRMANSADPIRFLLRSSLIWVYTVCSDLSVRKLRIITVHTYVAHFIGILKLVVALVSTVLDNRQDICRKKKDDCTSQKTPITP